MRVAHGLAVVPLVGGRNSPLVTWSPQDRHFDRALTAIIRQHGGMSEDAARDYKRRLVADKRYVRDVY